MDTREKKDRDLSQENTPDPVKEPAEAMQQDSSETPPAQPEEERKGLNHILWLLGGLYLVYTGFTLCKGYIQGDEESSLVFLLIGIAFLASGAFLAFQGYKIMQQREKEKKEKAAQGIVEDPPIGGFLGNLLKTPAPSEGERPKKRSIAERARLAKDLGDAVEEPTDQEDGEE